MNLVMILGRICFSLIFILAGFNKIMNWSASEQSFVTAMLDTLAHVYEKPWAQNFFDKILPHATKILMLGTAFELIGGLLVFLGWHARIGAILLFLVLVPATLLFHAFWFAEASARELQMTMFLKNLGLIGGCLILMAHSQTSKKSA